MSWILPMIMGVLLIVIIMTGRQKGRKGAKAVSVAALVLLVGVGAAYCLLAMKGEGSEGVQQEMDRIYTSQGTACGALLKEAERRSIAILADSEAAKEERLSLLAKAFGAASGAEVSIIPLDNDKEGMDFPRGLSARGLDAAVDASFDAVVFTFSYGPEEFMRTRIAKEARNRKLSVIFLGYYDEDTAVKLIGSGALSAATIRIRGGADDSFESNFKLVK